jgi:hypothetical protein
MWLIAAVAIAAAFTKLGGTKFHAQVVPFLGPLRLAAVIALIGAIAVSRRARTGGIQVLVRDAALTLGSLYLVVGAWGFRLLDSAKTYHRWTEAVAPAIAGRKVYFWQTIRSGAMVYTDHLMPELHSLAELEAALGPEDRLVSQDREWNEDAWGMTPQARMNFEVLLRVQTGSGELLLIRKRPQ